MPAHLGRGFKHPPRVAPASYDTTRDYRTILRSGAYTIGFAHLPHCVAGNIEVVAGMLAGANITVAQWAQFLALTTLGNVVSGVVFAALLNYSHVVWGTEGTDAVESIEAARE